MSLTSSITLNNNFILNSCFDMVPDNKFDFIDSYYNNINSSSFDVIADDYNGFCNSLNDKFDSYIKNYGFY